VKVHGADENGILKSAKSIPDGGCPSFARETASKL
jgi:hypothetical protein